MTWDFSFCCLVDTFNVYQDFQGPILLWVSLIYIVLLYGGNEHGKMKNHAHSVHIILSNFLWKQNRCINQLFIQNRILNFIWHQHWLVLHWILLATVIIIDFKVMITCILPLSIFLEIKSKSMFIQILHLQDQTFNDS